LLDPQQESLGKELMAFRSIIYMSVLALVGCAVEGTRGGPATHTLTGNQQLPQNDIETFLSSADWARLRSLEYARYAIMSADIRPDGSVIVGKVIASYPDASWNEIARSFAQDVILRAAGGTGSMLPMKAEIYVVLFKPESRGNLVLIFGQESDGREIVQSGGGGMTFVGQHIGTSNMDVSHRPKYIRTFFY
jgi:hypothetical protein